MCSLSNVSFISDSHPQVVCYGPYLLAFGIEQQDENLTPLSLSGGAYPSGAYKPPRDCSLILHAYDFCTSHWSSVSTRGSPSVHSLQSLHTVDDTLIAIGTSGVQPHSQPPVQMLPQQCVKDFDGAAAEQQNDLGWHPQVAIYTPAPSAQHKVVKEPMDRKHLLST
jgi:hypothetical protein